VIEILNAPKYLKSIEISLYKNMPKVGRARSVMCFEKLKSKVIRSARKRSNVLDMINCLIYRNQYDIFL